MTLVQHGTKHFKWRNNFGVKQKESKNIKAGDMNFLRRRCGDRETSRLTKRRSKPVWKTIVTLSRIEENRLM